MGLAKERAYQEEVQGWRYSDDMTVCSSCLLDHELKRRIGRHLSDACNPCTFCGNLPATEFDNLMEIVAEALMREWGHPGEAGAYWDGREGGWQGVDVFATEDILDEHRDAFASEDVFDAVVDAMRGDDEWVRRDLARLTPYQSLTFSWQEFRRAVMHKTRFVFWSRAASKVDQDDEVVPSNLLDEVLDMVNKYGMARVAQKGTEFVRARVSASEREWDAGALGTVPERLAIQSNRMSPSGIPMFYAASDTATAVAEANAQSESEYVAAGYFQGSRDILLVDLTNLPDVPSYFHEEVGRRRERDSMLFLHNFVRDLRKPVGQVREIDYIPTQVVTEYFLKAARGAGIADGLSYPSVVGNGSCYALDVDSDHCVSSVSAVPIFQRRELHLVLQRVDVLD